MEESQCSTSNWPVKGEEIEQVVESIVPENLKLGTFREFFLPLLTSKFSGEMTNFSETTFKFSGLGTSTKN